MPNIAEKPPITRYFNYGVTFRWTQGESHVVVKLGYVLEGKTVVLIHKRRLPITDLPRQVVGKDQEHWHATFPVNPSQWHDGNALKELADKWAHNNPRLVDLTDLTERPVEGKKKPPLH